MIDHGGHFETGDVHHKHQSPNNMRLLIRVYVSLNNVSRYVQALLL